MKIAEKQRLHLFRHIDILYLINCESIYSLRRDVEVEEELPETDTYNARETLPNTGEGVSNSLMSLHTNEEGNSQQSQEGSIADTIKELIIIIILKKNL